MNDEKLIFVSYYPGCCGQFVGGLCDILLNNKGYPMLQKTGEVSRILQRTLIGLENELNTKYIEITCMPTWGDEHRSLFEKLMSEWNIRQLSGQSHYVVTSHILALKELLNKFKDNKIILVIPKDQAEIDLSYHLWNIKNKPRGGKTYEKVTYENSSMGILHEFASEDPNVMVFNLLEILNEQNIDTNLNRIIKHLKLTDEYKPKAVEFYKEYLKKQQLS
jgi:hypothetical protein